MTDDLWQALRERKKPFSDWSKKEVPNAAGIYTIWDGERFLYVGIGTGTGAPKSRGLQNRLNAHASGNRGGDQFCVYICDRLVLPTLCLDEIQRVGKGEIRLNTKVKEYVRHHCSYSFVTLSEDEARKLETQIKSGASPLGKPLLQS